MRFRAGEQWWPDGEFERQHIKPEQEGRYEGDPWEQPIGEYVRQRAEARIVDIAQNCLGFELASRIGTCDQRRIAAVLLALGWRLGKKDMHGRLYLGPSSLL